MFDWLHKNKEKSEKQEDFILYGKDDNYDSADTESDLNNDTEDSEILQNISDNADTPEDYVREVAKNAFENQDTAEFDIGDDDGFKSTSNVEPKSFYEKYKSTIIASGITIAAGIFVAAMIVIISVFSDPLRDYTQVSAAKGNVVNSLNTEGTLSANARYSITSLVSGTIVSSEPKVGDKVSAGTVLYKLDDSEAQLAVKRAENQLARSKSAGSSTGSNMKIYALDNGTIQSLNIKSGYNVSVGQVIGNIKKADGTVSAITSSVSGTVSSVNSSVGKNVSVGTLLATLNGEGSSSASTRVYDQKSNEYDVEAAKKQLENYTIKSPVSGIVTEKNAKVGDNVGITNLDNPMMVIVDMNSLKFKFSVDEYRLRDMEVGQDVIINTESLPDETFAGTITSISSEGYKNDEGKTVFDIEVMIDDPGNLKAGMNVTAKVIMQSATNVIYLPKQALIASDGKNALVLVKETAVNDTNSSDTLSSAEVPKDATSEELAFPNVKVPKGCKLIMVSYGISDDNNVEIKSGIKVGDIIVYDPKNEVQDLIPSSTSTPVNTDTLKQSNNTASSFPQESSAPNSTEAKKDVATL